jgi:putative SOS response-associated peptidase YedK
MCYSAQVVQVLRKLNREWGLHLDTQSAFELFNRRLDDPGISISRGFEANFNDPANEAEQRCREAIDVHRGRAATKFEQELFTQKTRLVNAERSLTEKETKKAREDVRIASNKIESLTTKLADLRRADPRPRDNRIFLMVYAGVIIHEAGRNLLTPMRYFCRPAGKPAFYDKKFPGLYNARRDNLEKFWGGQFGHTHAILVVESFYENVKRHAMEHRELRPGEPEENVVLHFTPVPAEPMLIACLWSRWSGTGEADVRGFAAVTDEPPADVAAAGHDRCIVNLRPEHVAAWLTPQGRSTDELQAILSDRQIPRIEHEIQAAA